MTIPYTLYTQLVVIMSAVITVLISWYSFGLLSATLPLFIWSTLDILYLLFGNPRSIAQFIGQVTTTHAIVAWLRATALLTAVIVAKSSWAHGASVGQAIVVLEVGSRCVGAIFIWIAIQQHRQNEAHIAAIVAHADLAARQARQDVDVMGTKLNPGTFDFESDEPMFVLFARDWNAPELIEAWANLVEAAGERSEKIAYARKCAAAMRAWRRGEGR